MQIKWLNIILALFTLAMSVQPLFPAAPVVETCCSQTEACSNEKEEPADSCPNENNPFQLCSCCTPYVLLVSQTLIVDLTPFINTSVEKPTVYNTYLPSAALDECWRPPRLS